MEQDILIPFKYTLEKKKIQIKYQNTNRLELCVSLQGNIGQRPHYCTNNMVYIYTIIWCTICTDNWYTSVDLAEKLIAMHTYLVGTLCKNRRGNPQEVITQKLKRGEFIAKENKKE